VPEKNRIKEYWEEGIYHIYNRGVEKRKIFTDEQDQNVFLGYLKEYLVPKDTKKLQDSINNDQIDYIVKDKYRKLLRLNNFADQIDLLAFCLMPNHFHLLIKQKDSWAMEQFMKSFCTRYVQYFNHKHNRRVGPLFQGIYKAVLITSDEQLLHTSRYIHQNPLKTNLQGWSLQDYGCSSYQNYLGLVSQSWVKPDLVLSLLGKSGAFLYKDFVENHKYDEMTAILVPQGWSLQGNSG
jgi:putative transposase